MKIAIGVGSRGIENPECARLTGCRAFNEGAFLFLATEDSEIIAGQILNVDGGWIMY